MTIRIRVLQAWLIRYTSALCIPTICLWLHQSSNNFLSRSLAENHTIGEFKRWRVSCFPLAFAYCVQHIPLLGFSQVLHCRGDGQYFLLSRNILAGRQEVWPLVDLDCWGFVVPKLLTETDLLVQATLRGSSVTYRLDGILPSHQNTQENYQWTNRGNTVNQIRILQRTAIFCHFQSLLSAAYTLTFCSWTHFVIFAFGLFGWLLFCIL